MPWIVLELTPKGETVAISALVREITKRLPKSEVFIPSIETKIGDDLVTHPLILGYAFVRETTPPKPASYYTKLSGGKNINSVLMSSGKISYVADSYIEDLRGKARDLANQGIGVGDTVEVRSGPYKNLEAQVLLDLPETKQVQVLIQLRSKQAILLLPRSVLKVVNRSACGNLQARLAYIRSWHTLYRSLVACNPDVPKLSERVSSYLKVNDYLALEAKVVALQTLCSGDLEKNLAEVKSLMGQIQQLTDWIRQGTLLWSFVEFDSCFTETRLNRLAKSFKGLGWLVDLLQRVDRLSKDTEDLALGLEDDVEEGSYGNVFVDGANLLHRCYHAQSALPSWGTPDHTDMTTVFFLRSLVSLKKRFSGASIWVAWEGSSQRRIRIQAGYKQGRSTVDVSGYVEELKVALPSCGITQAYNPEEEADDIIATLVRESGCSNVIYSADKDFLQLVSEKTHLLVPPAGARKEVLYTPAKVLEAYGVPPSKILDLRAFFGDTSDALPGVPRVPKKVLRDLVSTYGSVKAVYSSSLSGLSRGQYDRVRGFEAQVRVNLFVMELVTVPLAFIHSAPCQEKAETLLGEEGVRAFFPNSSPIQGGM